MHALAVGGQTGHDRHEVTWNTYEKIRIMLQTFNPQSSMAEICREQNLVPRTVYGWKEKFLAVRHGSS